MHSAYLTIPKLAPVVVDAALLCIQKYGPARKPAWAWPAAFAVLGTVEITYQEPDALTHTACHQLQIWKDRKSVLRITWGRDTSSALKVLKLRRGAWVDEILYAAYPAAGHQCYG